MTPNRRTMGILGVAAASMAAAAGAYLYLGEGAPQRRRQVATWMRSAEREIVNEARKLKDAAFSEENYQRIIDMVAERYRQARNLDPEDIAAFVSMMRESWERAGEQAATRGSSGSTSARKKTTARSRSAKKKTTKNTP